MLIIYNDKLYRLWKAIPFVLSNLINGLNRCTNQAIESLLS